MQEHPPSAISQTVSPNRPTLSAKFANEDRTAASAPDSLLRNRGQVDLEVARQPLQQFGAILSPEASFRVNTRIHGVRLKAFVF
jgi:hypothetical protein